MGLTNEVQVGRFNGILHKLFAMKEGAPAPVLMPELLAGIILENDRPEYHFLAGAHLGMGGISSSGVVGELSFGLLANPVDSGALVILERFYSSVTAGSTIFWQVFAGVAPGTATARNTRDTRLTINLAAGQQTGLVGTVRFGSSAVSLITAAGGMYRAVTDAYQEELVVILAPGTYIIWEDNTANEGLVMHYIWRERALEPSETR